MTKSRRALPWLDGGRGLILLLVVVLLSRVPFLGAGYGLHWDAWGNAKAARQIAETGHYVMARVPGAPVYELTISLLAWGGPWALNGFSALCGVACVWIFALLARKYQCRDWLLASAAFAFTSVMYISSVTAKDFTLSCAFVLLSALFVARHRPVAAGVALGLAMGCRLPSGLMALPLALMLLGGSPREERFKQLMWFVITSAAVVTMTLVPAFLQYGTSFLTTYKPVYYPRWETVAYRGAVEVWSVVGCAGLAAAALGALALRRGTRSIQATPGREPLAWGAVILLYTALYLAFPDQAAYWLPALPFTILMLARFTPRWLFQTFCIMTIAGAFVSWGHGGPAGGAIFQDRTERLRTIANVRNFYDYARTIPGRNVFVIGAFYHGISLIAPESETGHFVYLLTAKELTEYLKGGFTIYYLPAIRRFEYDVHGIDLAQHGGIDVYAFRESQKHATQPE